MRKVFWNKLAQADYHQIIDYLLDEWGKTQAQIFIDQVAQIEWILKKGNVEFEKTNRANIRRCVLRKQVTLFYKIIDDKSIELLRFWNNYQGHKNLNL